MSTISTFSPIETGVARAARLPAFRDRWIGLLAFPIALAACIMYQAAITTLKITSHARLDTGDSRSKSLPPS